MKNKSNLFWVALQSNTLIDSSYVDNNFEEALTKMKDELKTEEWIFPTLHANMRNQVNIANIDLKKGKERYDGHYDVQNAIEKLKPGSSLIGEVPYLFKLPYGNDWDTKKDELLKHCFDLMNEKSQKNVVVLWDIDLNFEVVANDIRRVIKGKKVVSYPSKNSHEEGILKIKDFVEKSGHVLVTLARYFNGCEAANVIFPTRGDAGLRNCLLRGVQNVICIQLIEQNSGIENAEIKGMKEDNRFL